MKEIGNILREKRNEKGFSEEYVNAQTRIPTKYIIALEEGTLSVFPAEVYYLGSLRKYAKFLGLNDEDLIDIYRKNIAKTALIKQPSVKHDNENFYKVAKLMLYIILILGVFIIIWIERPSIATLVTSFIKTSANISKPVVAFKKTETTAQKEVKGSDFFLNIKCVEKTWVKVVADENIAFEGILIPGTEQEWRAENKFYISIGFVPGVEVSLNGSPVDISTGAKGDVNFLTLTKKNEKEKEGQ